MVSSEEFDAALKIIAAYRVQLEAEIHVNFKFPTIDLQHEISRSTFKALRYYYDSEFDFQIEWTDLASMDVKLLLEINFDKLSGIRGFGRVALYNFKQILVDKGVLNVSSLSKSEWISTINKEKEALKLARLSL